MLQSSEAMSMCRAGMRIGPDGFAYRNGTSMKWWSTRAVTSESDAMVANRMPQEAASMYWLTNTTMGQCVK